MDLYSEYKVMSESIGHKDVVDKLRSSNVLARGDVVFFEGSSNVCEDRGGNKGGKRSLPLTCEEPDPKRPRLTVTLDSLMSDYNRSSDLLDSEIEEDEVTYLAAHFDDVMLYLKVLKLSSSEQADVKKIAHLHGNQVAMAECLSLWRKHNPSIATLGKLLNILLTLRKEEVAMKICGSFRLGSQPSLSVVIQFKGTYNEPGRKCGSPGNKKSNGSSYVHETLCAGPRRDDDESSAAAGFMCPHCHKCTVEQYFSEEGCSMKPPDTKMLFPYLNMDALVEDDRASLEMRLKNETRRIIKKFSNFTISTMKSFVERNESLEEIIYVVLSLKAFTAPNIGIKFFEKEDIKEIQAATSIVDLFTVLLNYSSFFNYHIIEHLIDHHGSADDHKRLEDYVSDFKIFCQRSVFQVPPEVYGNSGQKRGRRFIVMCTEGVTTLVGVQEVRDRIALTFGLKPLSLKLQTIKKGSVELHFLIPAAVAKHIFPVHPSQHSALNEMGVRILFCEGVDQTSRTDVINHHRSTVLQSRIGTAIELLRQNSSWDDIWLNEMEGVLVTIRSSSVSIAKCYQGTAERNLTTQLGIECIRTFSSCQQRSEQWQEDRYREVECTLKTVVQTLLVTPGLGRLVSEICPPCRSNPPKVLVWFSQHNLKGVAEYVGLTNDEICHIFIKHSCDVQKVSQLMVRCLRVPNVGTCIDTQLILEVFENELKVKGFLKETTCEVPNTESKGGAVSEKEKKLCLGFSEAVRSLPISVVKFSHVKAERVLGAQLGIKCTHTSTSYQQRSEQWHEDRSTEDEIQCILKTADVQALLVTPGLGRLVSEICTPCVPEAMRSLSISVDYATAEGLAALLGVKCTHMFLSYRGVLEQHSEDRQEECTVKTSVQAYLAARGLGKLVSGICPPCKSNPLQALVLFNKLSVDNLNSVPECVVLTDDDIRHTFIKHSCDVQEIPQLMPQCLRISAFGTHEDTQRIIKVFKEEKACFKEEKEAEKFGRESVEKVRKKKNFKEEECDKKEEFDEKEDMEEVCEKEMMEELDEKVAMKELGRKKEFDTKEKKEELDMKEEHDKKRRIMKKLFKDTRSTFKKYKKKIKKQVISMKDILKNFSGPVQLYECLRFFKALIFSRAHSTAKKSSSDTAKQFDPTEPTAAVSSMDAVAIEQLEMEAQLKLIDFLEKDMKVFGATEPTAAVSSMDAVTIEQLEMEAQLKLIDFFERNMKVFGVNLDFVPEKELTERDVDKIEKESRLLREEIEALLHRFGMLCIKKHEEKIKQKKKGIKGVFLTQEFMNRSLSKHIIFDIMSYGKEKIVQDFLPKKISRSKADFYQELGSVSAKELTEKYDDLKKGKKLLADIEAQLQEWEISFRRICDEKIKKKGVRAMKTITQMAEKKTIIEELSVDFRQSEIEHCNQGDRHTSVNTHSQHQLFMLLMHSLV